LTTGVSEHTFSINERTGSKEEMVRLRICCVVAGVLLATVVQVCAQDAAPGGEPPREPFVLDWWSMDGGGGISAGGGFELLGTVGQPDTGVAVGEDYLLMSGFLPGGDPGIIFLDGFENGTAGRWDGLVDVPRW
jgi:hypothetical protein